MSATLEGAANAADSPTPTSEAQTPPAAEPASSSLEGTKAIDAVEVEDDASEWDAILPELVSGGTITLGIDEFHLPSKTEPGVLCKVRPARTRELLAIGRVLTGTIRPVNLHAIISPVMEARTEDETVAAAVAAFMTLVVTVPHSENEFIALVARLVDPVDNDLLRDEKTLREFFEYLTNPMPEDTVKVLLQMYTNEQKRLRTLGKALMSMFPALRSVGSPTQETENPGQQSST